MPNAVDRCRASSSSSTNESSSSSSRPARGRSSCPSCAASRSPARSRRARPRRDAAEVGELARRGVDVDVVGDLGALARRVGRFHCCIAHVVQSSALCRVPNPVTRSPPLTDPDAPAPWRVEILDESPSTNAYVAERARAGEPAGLVVVTEHQTAGRGRLDRTWETPRGVALTFSLLVRPGGVPLARWPWLPLLTGLAVVDAVRDVAGVAAGSEVAERRDGRRRQAGRDPRRARRAHRQARPRSSGSASTSPPPATSCPSRRPPRWRSRALRTSTARRCLVRSSPRSRTRYDAGSAPGARGCARRTGRPARRSAARCAPTCPVATRSPAPRSTSTARAGCTSTTAPERARARGRRRGPRPAAD